MPADSRDQLWAAAFETYYVAYFEEIAAEELIRTWLIVDDITKVVVAITASGSAISG